MKYYIKEQDIILKELYESYLPCKYIEHDGELEHTYTKQVLCEKSVSLYVDDVELYTKMGGRVGDFYEDFRIRDYPTWYSMSGIQVYDMPFYRVNIRSQDRIYGFEDYLMVTNSCFIRDRLIVDTEKCRLMNSSEGLTKVVTVKCEYYKSWKYKLNLDNSIIHFENSIDELINRIGKKTIEDSLTCILQPEDNDSDIVKHAKIQDCNLILSLWEYVNGVGKYPMIDNFRFLNFYASTSNGQFLDFERLLYSYKDYEDYRYKQYNNRFQLAKRLNMEEYWLSQAKDKEWAQEQFRWIMNQWHENSIIEYRKAND